MRPGTRCRSFRHASGGARAWAAASTTPQSRWCYGKARRVRAVRCAPLSPAAWREPFAPFALPPVGTSQATRWLRSAFQTQFWRWRWASWLATPQAWPSSTPLPWPSTRSSTRRQKPRPARRLSTLFTLATTRWLTTTPLPFSTPTSCRYAWGPFFLFSWSLIIIFFGMLLFAG